MIGKIKALFGGGKTQDDIFDKDNGLLTQAGNWLGGLQFTEQEKAEYSAQAAKGVVDYITSTLDESTTRSNTRRVVAITWISFELSLIGLAVLAWPFSKPYSEFVLSVAFSDLMVWGTLSVLAFFFGPYMIGKHFQRQGK